LAMKFPVALLNETGKVTIEASRMGEARWP